MNGGLKKGLDSIPLPETLDENIKKGFEKAKKEKGLRKRKIRRSLAGLAAAVTIIIGSLNIIGMDKVEAAIRQVLQYVPGYNLVVDKEDGEVWALEDQVLYEKGDIFVKISAAAKLDRHFNISLQSNYGLKDNSAIKLKIDDDRLTGPVTWVIGSGGEIWHGEYYFEIEEDSKNYAVLLGDLEIPLKLERTKEVEDFLQLGNHDEDKGISIVAIKKPLDNKLMVSLLNQSEDKVVYDYPFGGSAQGIGWASLADLEEGMYIVDKGGNKTHPTIPSSFMNSMSDFYFDIEDEEGLRLVLPWVKIKYDDLKTGKVKIIKPMSGEKISINKTLNLGKFQINIIDASLRKDKILINLDTNSPKDEVLYEARVNGVSAYGISSNIESGELELSIDEERVGKEFSISFESPISVLLGQWEINLD